MKLITHLKEIAALRWIFKFSDFPECEIIYISTDYSHAKPSKSDRVLIDESAFSCFEAGSDWKMREFISVSNSRVIVEPSFGWAVRGRTLISDSLYNVWVQANRKKISFSKYLTGLLFSKKTYLDEAICLLYAPNNYWHFHNNVVKNLLMFEKAGLLTDKPVLIPKTILKTNFFNAILKNSNFLKNLNWVFQNENEIFIVKKAYFSDTIYAKTTNFQESVGIMQFDSDKNPPFIESKKIFVTRRNCSRAVENEREVESLLEKYNFETIDCGNLSVEEQISTFKKAEFIIGLHGAALLNLIHCGGGRKKFLELMPSDWLNPCYYWMARDLNMLYGCMVTEPIKKHPQQMTSVDLIKLKSKLESMLFLD